MNQTRCFEQALQGRRRLLEPALAARASNGTGAGLGRRLHTNLCLVWFGGACTQPDVANAPHCAGTECSTNVPEAGSSIR